MTPAGNMIYPTCHAFTQVSPRDGYNLLIGLSTGDGKPAPGPTTPISRESLLGPGFGQTILHVSCFQRLRALVAHNCTNEEGGRASYDPAAGDGVCTLATDEFSMTLGGYAFPEFLACLCAVVVASVHQQLMASSNNTKVVGMLRFNIESEVDSTRVVGADWVPRQNGQFFVVGHLSGRVYLYNKVQIHSFAMECLVILLFKSVHSLRGQRVPESCDSLQCALRQSEDPGGPRRNFRDYPSHQIYLHAITHVSFKDDLQTLRTFCQAFVACMVGRYFPSADL
jgi:hypothetical protein